MTVRPDSFKSFLGQQNAVSYLKVAVRSALARKAIFGHTIFYGPSGVGKTTLGASVLPTELGCVASSLNCAALEKPEDLTKKLVLMKEGEILFLDEVHALAQGAREHLLTVMEDSTLTLAMDQAEPMVVHLPRFTVVASTTRTGNLDAPFRSRFKHTLQLDIYTEEEMQAVVTWIADSMEVKISKAAAVTLAEAAQGVARQAVTLVEACVDTLYGEDTKSTSIDARVAARTLVRMGYRNGLSRNEWRYLQALADHGGKVGLTTLSALLDEPQYTIQEVYEPHLLRKGFVQKTINGRILTPKGVEVLKHV
jgi:holliday junction DNA helicase RuvB